MVNSEQIKKELQQHQYEPSRYLSDFSIAGFTYYDGLDVIDELTLGKEVEFRVEPSNPYDPEAVAIFYKDIKLGYVPKNENSLISKFLYFGHTDLFQARIQYVNKGTHPEKQFRVTVQIKDNR